MAVRQGAEFEEPRRSLVDARARDRGAYGASQTGRRFVLKVLHVGKPARSGRYGRGPDAVRVTCGRLDSRVLAFHTGRTTGGRDRRGERDGRHAGKAGSVLIAPAFGIWREPRRTS
jgi:hypothetical protein